MSIQIKEMWEEVDKVYVGFSPNTTSVKPVHIANGLFRTALNSINDTSDLNKFVFWQKADGKITKGHDLNSVYQWLTSVQKIEESVINKEDIKSLRVLMKNALNADGGVYSNPMDTYSAGSNGFLSKEYVGQSGGELIAQWLKTIKSPLLSSIIDSLDKPDDIITVLTYPLLNQQGQSYMPKILADDTKFLNDLLIEKKNDVWDGLKKAAETLDKNLKNHPNKLYRLRMIVQFACFAINRHLASLEYYYIENEKNKITPFLLDFSDGGKDPVSRASIMTYTQGCQSITRFYTWAFSELLKRDYSLEELYKEETPDYKGKVTEETKELWTITIEEAKSSKNPYTVFGQAIYDILALQSEDPIRYFRQLGYKSGLMWPPIHPSKRFSVQQDMLEMLIYASVEPKSTIDLNTLQGELWDRFKIIIGGRSIDDERLLETGIYQADSSALSANREKFASRLDSLDFAKLLADGVLQIELEASNV